MTVTHYGNQQYYGLSSDTKPVAADTAVGAIFEETNTRKRYLNDGTDWILQGLPVIDIKKFKVFKVGATTYITDGFGRKVQDDTDTAQAVMDQMALMAATQVYIFEWDGGPFTIEQPIVLPSVTKGIPNIKKVYMKGQAPVGFRVLTGTPTVLIPSAAFPNQRYIFELNNLTGTGKTGYVDIDSFAFSNSANIAAGPEVGFVKFEADDGHGYDDFAVRNCYINYPWRAIHLIGQIWQGTFEHIQTHEFNATFVGDCVIILEDGGHSGFNNQTPKRNVFRDINLMHANGQYESGIKIRSGGYNLFDSIYIDGQKYEVAAIELNNTDTLDISSNTFQNVTVLDLGVEGSPTPDNRKGALYLAGSGTYDNVFRNMKLAPWPSVTVRLEGTGVQRNDIEIASYWGAAAAVTDTGTDGTNTIRVMGGHLSGGSDVKITHSGSMSRIIDGRRGASRRGSASIVADGVLKTFNIPHGCFSGAIPFVYAVAGSASANSNFYVTANATDILINYATPPAAATLIFRWTADVYA